MATAERRMRTGALAALVTFAVAACGSGGDAAPRSTAATASAAPDAQGRLRVVTERMPATLDPARASDLRDLQVVNQLHAGLMRYRGSTVVPDLAERWTRNASGGVYTFTLRSGVTWSDGSPLTAQQVRDSWLRALAKATRSRFAGAEMMNIRGALAYHAGRAPASRVGIDALDARTLRVRLEHPVPWLHYQVALPVFFPVHDSAVADLRDGRIDGAVVTAGPFAASATQPAGVLSFDRNARYWNAAAVAATGLQVRQGDPYCGDAFADAGLPRSSTAPGFERAHTAAARCTAASATRVVASPVAAVQYLWFDTRDARLADARVRRAIAVAVDRARLARTLGDVNVAVSSAAPGVVARAFVERGSSLRARPQRALARQLLRAARARPMMLRLAAARQDRHAGRVATSLRRDLAPLGIGLRLVRYDGAARAAGAVRRGRAELALVGWGAEFPDTYNLHDLFACSSNYNVARWCDARFDALMKRAVRAMRDGIRTGLERQAEVRLTGQAGGFPAAPLYADRELRYARGSACTGPISALGIVDLSGASATC